MHSSINNCAVCLLIGIFGCSSINANNDKGLEIVDRSPRLSGERYRCDDIIKTVNQLRRLGKKRALKVLRQYSIAAENSDLRKEDKIVPICFLLFINPGGWSKSQLGAPWPTVNREIVEKDFPLFPIALERGVPFMLVNGYSYAAMDTERNPYIRYLSECEHFDMINTNLAEQGYREAAEDLINSPQFRKLYSNTNEIPSEMILRQAEP